MYASRPSPLFLAYDRLLRQMSVTDSLDRAARLQAAEQIMPSRLKYRGPADGIIDESEHPLNIGSMRVAAERPMAWTLSHQR